MRRLSIAEIEHLSNERIKMLNCPLDEQYAFYDRLNAIACTIAFPLGELMNPNLEGYFWALKLKGMPKPRPITNKYAFGTQGLEWCMEVDESLPLALVLWREATSPDRLNIFVKGRFTMSDFIANVISVTKVRTVLEELLATYTFEKAEGQKLQDQYSIDYWDSACLTLKEVAIDLGIPLAVQYDKEDVEQAAGASSGSGRRQGTDKRRAKHQKETPS